MRRKLFLSSVFAALLPLSAQADVTLHLNDNVELLAYNGQTHKSSVFGKEDTVVLQDGTQQLAFRYVTSFEEGKDVTFVRSDVLVVKFDAQDTDVHFEFPEYLNKHQARKFNKNPEFTIKDASDNAIAFEQGKLIKSGFQLSRDYLSELQRYNQTDMPASLNLEQTPVAETAPAKPVTRSTKVVVNDSEGINEEEYQLHYWFQKADAQTKARFKAFVNAQ